MLTISLHKTEFLSFPSFSNYHGFRNHHKFHTFPPPWTSAMNNSGSFEMRKKEDLSIHVPASFSPQLETQRLPDLRFDRLQVPEKELVHERKFEFGQFVAREAVIDEEYWTAAWLRAESHWEDRTNERYVDNHKRKFADQEFHAIKRRRISQHGQKCRCIITVRKEERNVKRNVLKSVVGTLDLSIGCLFNGETFPGEKVKAPLFCSINSTGPNRYGYVSNLCVAKAARRQGIATNMLHFAVDLIRSNGVENVYVHVDRKNTPAKKLYRNMGFEIVEVASSQLLEEQTYLLCCGA